MNNALGALVRPSLAAMVLLVCVAGASEEIEHKRLYTAPDPEATGGITGRIDAPLEPIRQILAVPPRAPELVYRGEIETEDRRSFRFVGLPPDRYDLIVIFENSVYEGTRLHRDDDTLTPSDRAQIADTIERCEPFFDIKVVHRLEGTTGRGGEARAFCTFARGKRAEMYVGPVIRDGLRRTHKLVMLRQVGPGWQIERTRDLFPIWVEFDQPTLLRPAHHFREALSGIRVTDKTRDLGAVNLISR